MIYNEGEYLPGIFVIKVKKILEDNISCAVFTETEVATLIHEYVHFLQDISTQTGIIYFNFYSELLLLYLNVAKNAKEVELPIKLDACGVKNASEQSELLSLYIGNDDHYKIHHINKIVVENEELLAEAFADNPALQGKPLQQVAIYYDNKDTPYYFGGSCVRESMAYLIEHLAFGAELRRNEFPYNACEMVCEKVCPSLLKNPYLIVALCEFSLMHCNSGFEFYYLVKYIEQYNLSFKDVEELKLFFRKRLNFLFVDYEQAYKNAVQNVDIIYPLWFADTRRVNEQVKLYLQRGYEKRLSNCLFITDILLSKKTPLLVYKYIYNLAMPMLLDCQGSMFSNNDLQYMPVPLAVLECFTHPVNGCGLLRYGIKCSSVSFDEEICTHEPWLQCQNRSLCAFAVFLRSYNIDDKIFKTK